jgi:hypothetical protein
MNKKLFYIETKLNPDKNKLNMKTQNLFLLFIISIVSFQVYSQESYPLADFELRTNGVLYISETDSVAGTIKYNQLTSGSVSVIDASGKSKSYKAKEIVGFKTLDPTRNFYSIKSDGLDKSMLFYEDITPNGGKKLKLLKSFIQDGIIITNGQVNGSWESQLYSTADKKLLGTNFKKMAEQLKDCPALADKISKKQKGYYFGMISTPMAQEEVLNTIASEYNSCN